MHPRAWLQSNLPPIRNCLTILLYLATVLFGIGCGSTPFPNPVAPEYSPVFIDDADRTSLISATEHQLNYLQRLPPKTVVTIEGDKYDIGWLADSLLVFLDIITHTPPSEDLNRILHETFTIYQARGRTNASAGEMLITGYYQPLFPGSLIKTPPFLYPLYTKPESLYIRKDPRSEKALIGRLDGQGNLLPYWTRAEIEDHNLLAGNELVFLKDPIDDFFLHIQGSGRIILQDGSIRAVHISASNGREYKSIGKLLVDEQKIAQSDISMQSIRQYLKEHPSEIKHILHFNSKFVFFRWEDGDPRGSLGEGLTPGRSIAVDREALPMGAIGYIVTRRPVLSPEGNVIGWEPLRRFVLPQDTGEAIKGTGRADVFWGSGLYAETAAGLMKENGRLYFLVKKHP